MPNEDIGQKSKKSVKMTILQKGVLIRICNIVINGKYTHTHCFERWMVDCCMKYIHLSLGKYTTQCIQCVLYYTVYTIPRVYTRV